jgi:aryl-alcohol dehydrogenase-like predicted oxidoreductase
MVGRMDLERRRLGGSDLEVTAISLGSWLTYSGGVAREQAEACTRAAFEVGINFFDTANAYGRGAAEEAWGEILSAYPRGDYVLATKVFFPMSDTDRGLSATQIHKQIDASLARLRTDHVDLYQCHRYDTEVPIEETMDALSEVVRAGKARYLGFSEWTPEQIEAGLSVAGAERFVSSQPQYSMLWRAPEAEVIALCEREGISQIVWSPLAEGVLTGKYRPGEAPPADSRAASESMNTFIRQRLTDDTLQRVQRLRPIAEQAGLSMSQFALAWVLRQENVASAIIGASRPEQLHENAAAAGVTLGADVLAAIDETLGDVPVSAPTLAPGAQAGLGRPLRAYRAWRPFS